MNMRGPVHHRPAWRTALRQGWMTAEVLVRHMLFHLWALSSRPFSPVTGETSAHGSTVIIACYEPSRLRNLAPIIRNVLQSPAAGRVILSCHNPDLRVVLPEDLQNERVVVLSDGKRHGAGYRWEVARSLPDVERFLILDDDVLIRPHQVTALLGELASNPGVPQGLAGKASGGYVIGRDESVDELYMVYAATREHVGRYWALVSELERYAGVAPQIVEDFADYVVISQTGDGPPSVHDAGYLLLCPTATKMGVAVYKDGDFAPHRDLVRDALKEMAQVRLSDSRAAL